jgi:hypothetical protein
MTIDTVVTPPTQRSPSFISSFTALIILKLGVHQNGEAKSKCTMLSHCNSLTQVRREMNEKMSQKTKFDTALYYCYLH